MRRVNSQSNCNSKCCCCGCLDNLRICLLADGSTCPCCPLRGGLPSLSPARPAFSFLFSPHPPSPLPLRGRGRFFVFLCKGLRPLHPRGLNPGGTGKWGRTTRPAGACLVCCLPTVPLACFPAPIPPAPLPGGKGESQSLFRRGLRPRHPCPEPLAAFIVPAKQVPNAEGSLRFGAKPIEPPFFEQCRQPRREGDRGRWNYPSQATAAFEMVLSPGAGRTSAAGVQPPGGYSGGKVSRQPTGQALRRVHV